MPPKTNYLLDLPLDTYVLTFDAESNGLHGPAFAVAGTVCRLSGDHLADFSARCPTPPMLDPWVAENILPLLDGPEGLPINHGSSFAMRDAFWFWLQEWRNLTVTNPSARVLFVVDFGIPVESNLLSACVADDRRNRHWDLPYPAHELGTFLLAAGYDPDVNREELAQETGIAGVPRKHDPRWDAKVSCHLAVHCIQRIKTAHSIAASYFHSKSRHISKENAHLLLPIIAENKSNGTMDVMASLDLDVAKELFDSPPLVSMGCVVKQTTCSLCGSSGGCPHLGRGVAGFVPDDLNFLYVSVDSTPRDPSDPARLPIVPGSIELFGLGGGMKHEPPPADAHQRMSQPLRCVQCINSPGGFCGEHPQRLYGALRTSGDDPGSEESE